MQSNPPLKALIALLLIAAIPLLVWSVVTQSFEVRDHAETTDEKVACTTNAECGCALDIDTGACAIQNSQYLEGQCTAPDFCSGISGDCVPACVEGQCTLQCPQASPSPTPTGTSEPTPTPTQSPFPYRFDIRITFAGVTDSSAEGTGVFVRFINGSLDLVTPKIAATHVSGSQYKLDLVVPAHQLPEGDGYRITIKGEKHVARKFCRDTGQTSLCQPSESITLSAPQNNTDIAFFDFTGLTLDPGDLQPQDGRADASDFQKIRDLLGVTDPTQDDLVIADLNYDSVINVLDAFWMRKTLETRYDE